MPELPDIVVYIEALEERVLGQRLEGVRMASPFLLRTADPKLESVIGRSVRELRRLGKRIALGFDNDVWLVLHLMIAGRLQWNGSKAAIPGGKRGLAAFDFATGTLLLTEAGSKKRAALHVATKEGLAEYDRGGLEVLEASEQAFSERLRLRNHTLKRALTDPTLFSGIGNAYSDEILHLAKLSPVAMTQRLTDEKVSRLYVAIRESLTAWTDRLRKERLGEFPIKVTAFRPEMAVHGKYGKPCPVCATAVQRIRHASNETNYCPICQTGGKLLADRALSRLLKSDWPRSLEEMEERKRG